MEISGCYHPILPNRPSKKPLDINELAAPITDVAPAEHEKKQTGPSYRQQARCPRIGTVGREEGQPSQGGKAKRRWRTALPRCSGANRTAGLEAP